MPELCATEPPPVRDTAGIEESRFREEQRLEKMKEPETVPEPAVVETPPAAPPPSADATRFTVREVKFLGNHSIAEAELAPLTAGLMGREISFADVEAAVKDVKQYYRKKGFIAAYAFVPPQQMKEGLLKIDVLEGRLGEVKIGEGARWTNIDSVKRMVRMKAGDVLTYEAVRRDLARLNKHDLAAKAVLEPGAQTGTTDLRLNIEGKAPYHISLDANNQGTENTGRYRYGVFARHTNLTGRFDELFVRPQLGDRTLALGVGYEFPVVPSKGTDLGYSFSYADVGVGGPFEPLDVKGEAFTHSVYLKQPLIEREALGVAFRGGLDVKSVENKILSAVVGEEEIRVLKTALEIEAGGDGVQTYSTQAFDFGLDALGASKKDDARLTRPGTGGSFFVYRGMLARFQKLWGDLLISSRASWQLTGDALAPSEQLRLGGALSVRGHQEGEYLADNGGYANFDVYHPMSFLPAEWKAPFTGEPLKEGLDMLAFADVSHGRVTEPLAGETKSKDLASIGVGLRLHLYDKLFARVEWGFPVGTKPIEENDYVFHFTVNYELM